MGNSQTVADKLELSMGGIFYQGKLIATFVDEQYQYGAKVDGMKVTNMYGKVLYDHITRKCDISVVRC